VVVVVILFLQTWRASIIPLLAVPVSIIGTFALMLAFGYSTLPDFDKRRVEPWLSSICLCVFL